MVPLEPFLGGLFQDLGRGLVQVCADDVAARFAPDDEFELRAAI
jgi:hypothetical protein